jgi:hypothetical protein
MRASQFDQVAAAHVHVPGGVDPVRDREQQLRGSDQFGEVPQELQPPPQQPPPPSTLPKSSDSDGSPPATAKLETNTLVLVDSQAGHAWAVSRSANLVRRSNFSEQLSQRYS